MKWGGAGAEETRPGSRHFHFIQKNLTRPGSSGRRGRPRASCGAQKVWRRRPYPSSPVCSSLSRPPPPPRLPPFPPQEHSILLSISSLGRTLRGAVAGSRRGALERAAWTVAVRTEAVMRRHCRTLPQVCVPECSRGQTSPNPTGPPRVPGLHGPRLRSGWAAPPFPGRAGRGGRAHSLTALSPTAEPAARGAPCPASRRPKAAPAARPGRRRHLLGEALRAARPGLQGLLARPGLALPPAPCAGRGTSGAAAAWRRASFCRLVGDLGPSLDAARAPRRAQDLEKGARPAAAGSRRRPALHAPKASINGAGAAGPALPSPASLWA